VLLHPVTRLDPNWQTLPSVGAARRRRLGSRGSHAPQAAPHGTSSARAPQFEQWTRGISDSNQTWRAPASKCRQPAPAGVIAGPGREPDGQRKIPRRKRTPTTTPSPVNDIDSTNAPETFSDDVVDVLERDLAACCCCGRSARSCSTTPREEILSMITTGVAHDERTCRALEEGQ
jgi:hypothetical protein